MRADGRSQREIVAELHVGEQLLKQLLRGTAVPDSLRRPRAKDDLRARAMEMRLAGATYDEIVVELGVSKSSCSLWLRDLPRPEGDPERRAAAEKRRTDALRARMARDVAARQVAREESTAAVAWSVGSVTARDLALAVAVSYWCEGAKRKPWNRNANVQWMNSDPMLVRLYLEGLWVLGVRPEQLRARLHIHVTADEPAARAWWSEQTGLPLDQFLRSTLKRHSPATNRKNVDESYRGCLCITVLGGQALYDVLAGLVHGLACGPREPREWHDEEDEPVELQADRDVPSALV
jgi:hypothetical protein